MIIYSIKLCFISQQKTLTLFSKWVFFLDFNGFGNINPFKNNKMSSNYKLYLFLEIIIYEYNLLRAPDGNNDRTNIEIVLVSLLIYFDLK